MIHNLKFIDYDSCLFANGAISAAGAFRFPNTFVRPIVARVPLIFAVNEARPFAVGHLDISQLKFLKI